jgi:hypothetical protein
MVLFVFKKRCRPVNLILMLFGYYYFSNYVIVIYLLMFSFLKYFVVYYHSNYNLTLSAALWLDMTDRLHQDVFGRFFPALFSSHSLDSKLQFSD